jgi:hypothetical protein
VRAISDAPAAAPCRVLSRDGAGDLAGLTLARRQVRELVEG